MTGQGLSQQRTKARLFEMAVAGQSLGNAHLLHHNE